jgi:hypothetical protein
MTLTVIKNPETICPIYNPKVVIIGTNNQFSTPGVTAKLYLKFSVTDENPGSNDTFRYVAYLPAPKNSFISWIYFRFCGSSFSRHWMVWLGIEKCIDLGARI